MDKYLLFDGDVLAYRAAWSEKENPLEQAKLKLDELISDIVGEIDPWGEAEHRKFFLTGKGNFRKDVAKTAVYKGNRKNTPKPDHLADLRQYLVQNYDALVTDGCEADDAIGIYANYYGYDNVIIVSIDKDFEQIPTTIFNPSKWELRQVSKEEAIKNFYKQVLTGDRVDNIIGIKGVGPVSASKILENCTTEKEMYDACVASYTTFSKESFSPTAEAAKERVLENARLLWIQRYHNEMWEPPK